MKVHKDLLEMFSDFIEEAYGVSLEVHSPAKGEEVARGMVEGRFLALELSGAFLRVVTNDSKFIEEDLSVLWEQYMRAINAEMIAEENKE